MNLLTSAHPEPSSLLLLMLVHRLLILLRLQTPSLFSLFHNFGGEGGGDGGMPFHHPPWPHSPGKMFKSSCNRFGMTTPPIVLTGSTAGEIIVEAMAIKVWYLSRRPGKFDFADQAFIWQAIGQKFLQQQHQLEFFQNSSCSPLARLCHNLPSIEGEPALPSHHSFLFSQLVDV